MNITSILKTLLPVIRPLVPFNAGSDRVSGLDLSSGNQELSESTFRNTDEFSRYINEQRRVNGSRYLVGGYNEYRTIYARSEHFDAGEEPRRLHLGVDIWGDAGTEVYAPLPGTIHSFRFNNNFGDYGATIILQHCIENLVFHTLYGHLDLISIQDLKEGDFIGAGQNIARFGLPEENGYWPPHLHFQIIIDMEGMKGDYPGVCKFSERERYLKNCPDANLLLFPERAIEKASG